MNIDFAYSVFLQLFPVKSLDSESRYLKLAITLAIDVLIFVQNIQFFWYTEMTIKNWAKYETFWEVLCIPALDRFLSSISSLKPFLFFIISIEVLSVVLISYIVFQTFLEKSTKPIICILTRLVVVLVSRLLFIPSLSILLFTYRSSKMSEYDQSKYQKEYSETVEIGSYGEVLCVLLATWLIFLTFCYEVTHFEMRPRAVEKFEDSKISPMSDLIVKFIQILNCFLITFLTRDYYETFLIYCILAYGISSLFILYSLPYYSNYMNFFKFFIQFDLMFISIFFIVGLNNDDSLTILMLSTTMQPGIMFLAYSLVTYREKLIKRMKANPNKGFPRFERSIRGKLRTGADQELLAKLNKNYVATKDKKNLIITAYYSNDIEKLPSLAMNKVFSTDHQGLNFALNYHIFTCKFTMRSICKYTSFTYKIYQYILSLMEIKRQDKDFCLVYYNFFKILLGKSPSLAKVKESVKLVVESIKILEKNYEKYINEFPSSSDIKDMYESFLCCIKGEVQTSQNLLGKSFKTSASHLDNFNSFIKNKVILMISGNSRTLGRIIFTNQEFLIMLKYSKSAIEDLNINVLLPKLVCKIHEKSLHNFIESSISSVLCDQQLIFLLDFEGYLIESILRADCIALDDQIRFIYSIEILNRSRELALISEEGWIFDHSRKLPNLLGIQRPYISNSFLQEVFPDFSFENLRKKNYIKIEVNSQNTGSDYSQVYLHLKQVKVFDVLFNVLYVQPFPDSFEYEDDQEFYTIGRHIESLENETEKIKSHPKFLNFKDTEEENDKNDKEFKMPASSTSHYSIGLNFKEMNSFKKSILVLNITKIILIVLVSSI